IYKNSPIFYSLGNFIFQNDSMIKQPTEFYDRLGLNYNNNVSDLYDVRSNYDSQGFVVDEEIWLSIIPVWKQNKNKITELKIYPIDLGMKYPRSRRGSPKLTNNKKILENLQKLSK